MNANQGSMVAGLAGALLWGAGSAQCQDWPQWRGPDRDGKVAGFKAPAAWPKQLAKKWSVKIGDGVATPALVGDRLYAIGREGSDEVVRCLDAATGKEHWQAKYPQRGASGPASGFAGPRSSPTVVDGKVVTLGCGGTLSCFDAASGALRWRKTDYSDSLPRFATASSPVAVGGLCVVQLGSEDSGAIVAYRLADGAEQWKRTEDGTTYSSPVLANFGGQPAVVALGRSALVGLDAASGKLLWSAPFKTGYNACTPVVAGDTVVVSGGDRGGTPFTKAFKIDKQGDGFAAKELWTNAEYGVQYNTPVVRDGQILGLSARDVFFCLDAATGKTAWTAPKAPAVAGAAAPPAGGAGPGGGPPGGGKKGRMGGGRMGGSAGYGSIVDAGSVILALTPTMELIAFEPSGKKFAEVARIKVADSATYAYPVVSGNRLFVKDKDSVSLLAFN